MEFEELIRQEQELNNKLVELPQQKWKVLKYVLVGIFFSFISPYLIRDRGNQMKLTSDENYLHAVAVFGVGTMAIVALISYYHIKNINYEIYSIKYDIDRLKERISEIKNIE